MTEKNAAFGNNFTPEQRSAALKRATEMRAARAEYLGRVKSGEVSIADALEAGKGDPVVGRIKAKRLLMALPGIGAAKAQSAMTAIGISAWPASASDRPKSSSSFSGRRALHSAYQRTWKAIREALEPSPIGRRLFQYAFQGDEGAEGASRSGNMDWREGGTDRARIASRANVPAAPHGAR